MTDAYALFETPIGRCAIAWNATHILAIQIPERDDATTIARLIRKSRFAAPAIPPPFVAAAIGAITAHLAGKLADLDAIPLDLNQVTPFDRAVLAATRRIASGTTRTYGAIAAELGDPQAARAVGAALGRNPWPIVVPCHRVLAANGKLGGFSAPGGRETKLRLLDIEGAKTTDHATLFDRLASA